MTGYSLYVAFVAIYAWLLYWRDLTRVYERYFAVLSRDDEPSPIHPREPAGVPFNEWEMSTRFPRLVAKYGYKDSEWISKKIRQEKAAKDWEDSRRLTILMTDSGIVTSQGVIPPFRIVKNILRTGKSPDPNREFTWEPCELDEGNFWQAVTQLENKPLCDKESKSDPMQPSYRLDVHAPDAANYPDWIRSLKQRGQA